MDSLDKQQKYLLKDFACQNLYLPLDNEKATLLLTSFGLAFLCQKSFHTPQKNNVLKALTLLVFVGFQTKEMS